jgi:3-methyladenine DNA glycosylase AlkD
MTLDDVDTLLRNNYHEIRLAGVLILVYFAQKKIYPWDIVAKFYMDHVAGINNWDLVDVSSEHIIGPYIEEYITPSERDCFINTCVTSSNLWVNRIIMLASFYQIKQWDPRLTLSLAKQMLWHKHDLMHKATGWMLREVGKRCSLDIVRDFLSTYAHQMPRTMLRYTIEKMPPDERRHFMSL